MSGSLSKRSLRSVADAAKNIAGHKVANAETLFVESERLRERDSLKEAHELLLKAAALGHTGAQVTLGNNFSSGSGVRSSEEQSAYWYKRAYRGGDESGAFNLAVDKLRAQNTRAAVFWFSRAYEMGSGEAALELAKILLTKKRGKHKAIHILEATQSMKPYAISDLAKEEAKLLLSKILFN